MSVPVAERGRLVATYDALPAGSPRRAALLAQADVTRTQLANWRSRLGLQQCRCGRERAKFASRCSECAARAERDQHLRRTYGITIDDYDRMATAQRGLCAACGEPPPLEGTPSQRALHVDHDHKCARVRGLLCHPCNLALGYAGECPQRLEALAFYVRRTA